MNPYRIAPAAPADAPIIHDIQMRAFAQEGRLSGTMQILPLMEEIASIENHIRTQTVMTARDGVRVIGSARGIADGSVCTLRGVSVDLSHQGQGIGAALVGAVEGAHPGVARFELRTNTLVAGNVQFYERRGYHVTELVTVSGKIVLAQMAKDNDSATRPNGYSLLKLSHEQTVDIAQAHAPSNLAGRIAAEALPPPRVGQRALLRLADGKSPYWCAIFLIVRNADDVVVGSCCFKNEPQDGRVEIGYGIAPECRRQGAARAAVLTLLQLAGAAGATAVLAQVNPENVASACVVRGAGFIDTGTREDELGETVTHWVARL